MTTVSEDSIQRAVDPVVLDLYKLAVELADRVSARRSNANAFFLTVQSVFVAAVGLSGPALAPVQWWFRGSVALAGVLLSASWWLQLRSYRDLNSAKFAVISAMEESLPAQIFSDEWITLKRDRIKRWRDRYAELGSVERVVPWIFAGIYLAMFVGGFWL